MAYVKKPKKDPRDEYFVIHTYDNDSEKTLDDILSSKEYLEMIYKLMIKYS